MGCCASSGDDEAHARAERPASWRTGPRWPHEEPVWWVLRRALDEQARLVGRPSLEVLDAGGGTGSFAVPIAELGHRVTVIDPSLDSLAALGRRVAEAGMTDRVRGLQGDAAEPLEVLDRASADLVVCHHVLDAVENPRAVLNGIAETLRPGARVSVVAANRNAVVLGKVATGHLADARRALTDVDGRWGRQDPLPRRFAPEQLEQLLATAGCVVEASHGVHTFRDLVPAHVVEEPNTATLLADLEATAAERPPFAAIASHLHVLARWETVSDPPVS